jgi:hypothetical protein
MLLLSLSHHLQRVVADLTTVYIPAVMLSRTQPGALLTLHIIRARGKQERQSKAHTHCPHQRHADTIALSHRCFDVISSRLEEEKILVAEGWRSRDVRSPGARGNSGSPLTCGCKRAPAERARNYSAQGLHREDQVGQDR